MFTRAQVQQYVASQLHQPSVPYVGRLPDGTHVLAGNKSRVLVKEVRGELQMQTLKAHPNGAR